MSKSLLVGITGGSGSGKTFILDQLKQTLGEKAVCVISQDNYYRPLEEQFIDENGVENFDLPESIDHAAFAQDLIDLKSGKSVRRKEYVFNNKNATPKFLTFNPADIIVAEGLFVFYLQDVFEQLDLKVFIDCDRETMVERRIQRDAVERGYDMNDVMYRYENHVMPAFRSYIEPHKSQADILIENTEQKYHEGLTNLLQTIKMRML